LSNDTKAKTVCKNCIFSEYDEHGTQTGCEKNIISKLEKIGTNIQLAYDEEREFYIIPDRVCHFYRDHLWSAKFYNDENKQDSINKMIQFENSLKFCVFIVVKKGDTIEDIFETLESLKSQSRIPFLVCLLIAEPYIDQQELSKKIFKMKPPFAWRMECICADLFDTRDDWLVARSLKQMQDVQYYSVCYANYKFEKDFFDIINEKVCNEFLQFAMIKGEDDETGRVYKNATLIPKPVHDFWFSHISDKDIELLKETSEEEQLNFYKTKTIEQKLQEFECQNPEQKVVLSMKEVKNYKI